MYITSSHLHSKTLLSPKTIYNLNIPNNSIRKLIIHTNINTHNNNYKKKFKKLKIRLNSSKEISSEASSVEINTNLNTKKLIHNSKEEQFELDLTLQKELKENGHLNKINN